MKRKILALLLVCAGLSLALLGSCRHQPSARDYVESLPDLPQEIAATLDSKTLATKVSVDYPGPVKEPDTALAPCCGSRGTSSLKVKYRYTKCGPLRDFILAPIGNLRLSEKGGAGGNETAQTGDFKAYKLGEFNGKKVDETVCVTSEGPWNATLFEDRFCFSYSPHHTLHINAFGNLVQFVWNAGIENHPPQVQLVSCRAESILRFPCGGIGSCECFSSTCPQDQPCDCGFAGKW